MVRAALQYVRAGADAPVYHASTGGAGAQLAMDGEFAWCTVEIADAREMRPAASLDANGYALLAHSSAVSDFYDDAQIAAAYRDEVQTLVCAATGANRALMFDHTRRASSGKLRGEHRTREPSAVVHNDYTERSAPQRVRDLLPSPEAETLLARRFAIVNVWRSIRGPVLRAPLALCDAASIAPDDLVASERRARDRIGEIYLVRANRAHRWAYFPRLQPDEAILIKTFDSARDAGARFSVHTAFEDPQAAPDSPPRESIEARAFAFFD